jgi:hypothetical protein
MYLHRVIDNFYWRIEGTSPTNQISTNRFRAIDPIKKTPRKHSGDIRAFYVARNGSDEDSAATDLDRREAWHDFRLHMFYPAVYPWQDLQRMIVQDRHDLAKVLRSMGARPGWDDDNAADNIGLYERQRATDTTDTTGDVYEVIMHWRCKIREEEQ